MAKIVTIDIDLGIDIESMIQNDVLSLTSTTQRKLDESIKLAKSEQAVYVKQKEAKDLKAKMISDKLVLIIDTLMTAGDAGADKSKIIEIAEPVISISGLATRLRSELRNSNSEYRLKITKNKYSLVLHGKEDSEEEV